MIEFFVKHKVTTLMFVLVFVVLGLFSYSNLAIEKFPKVDFPMVTVSVTYPGATPQEVETLVVKKVEDAIAEVSEIKKIKSKSYDSLGFISIEFLIEADVNVKSIEVKDKVEAILNDLPGDIEKPIIEKYDPTISPVVELVLSSDTKDARDLYEYADKVLKNRLSSVRGVAKVDVYGGKKRQINVWLDPLLMKQHYISIGEVIAQMSAKNKNIPAGNLDKGFNSLGVRFTGEFASVDEIANMRLTSSQGESFLLKDIAVVKDSFKRIESLARFNGKDAVGLSINKASDSNGVYIARQIKKRLKDFQANLPEGMRLDIASDTTTFIVDENNSTQWGIVIGIFLTVLILYLFLGRWDITFVASVIIPTSIVSTFFPMWMSDFSINMLTLLSMATVLGTLISNAIVIIENVIVHLERTSDPERAAIEGTKEVFVPIIASTGTNLVVFLPLAMMGGMIGLFMKSFGLTVVYATFFSLFASFALTPMMCALVLKPQDKKQKNIGAKVPNLLVRALEYLVAIVNKANDWMKAEYKHIFDWMFRHPKITVISVAVVFVCSFMLMPFIDNDFASKSDENQVIINMNLPQGSTIERTAQVTKKIEKYLETIPEGKSYLTNIGTNGVENAKITLDLVPLNERKRKDTQIIDQLCRFMATMPDVEVSFDRGFSLEPGSGDVALDLYGTDYDTMIALSRRMKAVMEKTGYFSQVTLSYKTPKTEMKFVPNEQKLLEYGVNAATVGTILRASIYGNDDNSYKEKGDEYDVNIELDDKYAQDFDDIKSISLLSRKGLIPVTELGELKVDKALPAIWHRDKARVIHIDGFLGKGSLVMVMNMLNKEFKKLDFPQGYKYKYTGDSEQLEESNAEMGRAFLLAIILTFMFLCGLMNSLIAYPVAVMTTVATSLIGIILSLFFLRLPLNFAGLMGIVMLVGIVVNNAILLLDYALIKMREGVDVKEALWLGASEKFRAIIMTSLAIISGVLPQLFSSSVMKQSMGAVMTGGIIASILFTFFLVPVAFWYLEKLERRLSKKKS